MSNRILMIAYHYPPILHSSGVHRTAKFVQYLPEWDWYPDVLTVHPRAYINTSPDIEAPAANTTVTRAFALDTARHLSIQGKYFKSMALPDRWVSWCAGAIPAGLQIIKKQKPKIIWSTYPIASAHIIGYWLHKFSGLPWVVDFRDPMTDIDHPSDAQVRDTYLKIESRAIKHCSHAIFTTPDTQAAYVNRFPDFKPSNFHVIPNGFDEDTFRSVESKLEQANKNPDDDKLLFVHAGSLYPSERNPIPFFNAIADLKSSNTIHAGMLKISLRASSNEEDYMQLLKELNIDDIVFLDPPLPYEEALSEMLVADGLLMFQAANCNHQIPAKAYEYIRAKRPIFTLTDPKGNTAKLLNESGYGDIVELDNMENIKTGLISFIGKVRNKTAPIASKNIIETFSRKNRTHELVKVLDSIAI